jgi:hypothetical protein
MEQRMKEPYRKGIANHSSPESYAGHSNTAGEALTTTNAGQPLVLAGYSSSNPAGVE